METTAKQFAQKIRQSGNVPVLAKVKLAKGTKASYIDLIKKTEDEAEILLQRNSRFIIRDRYIDKKGMHWIVLENIL